MCYKLMVIEQNTLPRDNGVVDRVWDNPATNHLLLNAQQR